MIEVDPTGAVAGELRMAHWPGRLEYLKVGRGIAARTVTMTRLAAAVQHLAVEAPTRMHCRRCCRSRCGTSTTSCGPSTHGNDGGATPQYTYVLNVDLTESAAKELRLSNKHGKLKLLDVGLGDQGKNDDDSKDGSDDVAHGNGSPDKNALTPMLPATMVVAQMVVEETNTTIVIFRPHRRASL